MASLPLTMLYRTIAAVGVSGSAWIVYNQGAGMTAVGVNAIGLLEAETDWIVKTGAQRVLRAARGGGTDKLIEAGAVPKLIHAAGNADSEVRSAVSDALVEMLAEPSTQDHLLRVPRALDTLKRCAECEPVLALLTDG